VAEYPEPIGSSLDLTKKQIKEHLKNNRPVLLLGETGTGKSMLARWACQEFGKVVEFSCVDVGDELFRSTVFGHKRGSFTGAVKDQEGLIEEAGDGFLFLDEIGDLVPKTQSALLRVVETKKYRKLGATKDDTAKCEFIAATKSERWVAQRLACQVL
jgi:two-component system nitrogen regulation response regulator NtrX